MIHVCYVMPECVFLYSSFVRLCVLFRMAVGDQLAIRVFREGFPYFKYCKNKGESSLLLLFSKRQLLESHLHITDYGVASLDGF